MDVSHDDVEPITDTVHDNSWSANLEKPQHADDRSLVVNLVTHGDHGHPDEYLYDALADAVDDVDYEYVEQCGCGGHVTRVHV